MLPERIERIRDLYENRRDLSLGQIAEIHSIHVHTINNLVKTHNWPRRGKNTYPRSRESQLTKEQIEKIRKMYDEGYVIEIICTRFGLNKGNFEKLRQQESWPPRRKKRGSRFEFVEDFVQ